MHIDKLVKELGHKNMHKRVKDSAIDFLQTYRNNLHHSISIFISTHDSITFSITHDKPISLYIYISKSPIHGNVDMAYDLYYINTILEEGYFMIYETNKILELLDTYHYLNITRNSGEVHDKP